MADVITRFKLETTQFDSKLRDASKGLQDIVRVAQNGGKGFTDFSQKSIQAAKDLGTIASGATNLKDKVKDLVGAYNDAAKAYNKLSQEQQQSDFGKALAGSINQLSDRIKEAKSELYSLGDAAQQTSGKMQGVLGAVVGGRGGMVGNIAAQLGATKTQLLGISAAVAGAGAAFKLLQDNVATALNFEKSMSQLSSLTGMVGKDLDQLKEYAIELGSTTTLTASQVADAFRLIGSQQPQLLESGAALKEVTKYAIRLSEAAGIDLLTASQTLSTSINQMGGDSANAARYVNVLAAASQKGAGDIAWLGEAITKSATAAKAVGTDYEELVANLEQLAKAGFDASTAGTALRSIIMNLEKQANDEFKPSIVGLTQAFDNLGKANLSIVEYQQIAGKMFASQAMALANAAGEARNMTEAITGTSIAEEQAATNTANLDGSLKALASAWEGLNLHLNASNGLLKTVVDGLKDVVTWADKAIQGIGQVNGDRARLNNENGGGQTRIDRQIGILSNTNIDKRQSIYSQQVEKYWRYINEWNAKLSEAENRKDVWAWETIKKNNDIATAKANVAGAQSMLKEYQDRAKKLLTTSSPTSGKAGKAGAIDLSVDVDTEDATKSIKQLQEEIKKLKKLRDDAANTGDTKLRDQYNAQIKSLQAEIKSMRGGGSNTGSRTVSKPEQAQARFDQAEKDYQQALAQAALQLKAGTITEADAKKKELQAKESLWKSIGDAREVYDSPQMKSAQEKVEAEIVKMGGEVKAAAEAQEAAKKAARELEAAQKKLADAENKLAEASKTGSATAIYRAQQEVDKQQKVVQQVQYVADVKAGKMPTALPEDMQVEFTVAVDTDEALAKLREIQGVQIDPKTLTVTTSDNEALTKLREIQGVQIDPKTVKVVPKVEPVDTSDFDSLKQTIQTEIKFDQMKVDETTLHTLLSTALQNGLNSLTVDYAGIQEKISKGIDIPDSTWVELQNEINAKLAELGIEPIKINLKTGQLESVSSNVNKMAKAWQTASTAINAAGSAMSSLKNPAIDIMTVIGQSIASVALAYSQTLAQDKTSKSNIWAFIAAATAATVSMATTISQIHSATGYAQGGEVKGNSYSGDNMMAMGPDGGLVGLNAGEIVLTRAMAGNLASQLQSSDQGGISIVGVLKGEDILLMADRAGRRSGRGELVFFK